MSDYYYDGIQAVSASLDLTFSIQILLLSALVAVKDLNFRFLAD
jgi:hypothetical protein